MVDHALHDAGAVAQVDEGQVLAVLAAHRHPAAEGRPPARRVRGAARRTSGFASCLPLRAFGRAARARTLAALAHCSLTNFLTRSTKPSRATASCSAGSEILHHGGAVGDLLLPHDHARRRPRRRRPSSSAPSCCAGHRRGRRRSRLAAARRRAPSPRRPPTTSTTKAATALPAPRTPPRHRRPAACGRRRGRGRCRGWADRRGPRPARRSDRRRRWRPGWPRGPTPPYSKVVRV